MSLQRITQWFIPESIRQHPEAHIRARTVVSVGLLAGLIAPLFALSYFRLQHPAMGIGIIIGAACLLCGPILLRLSGALQLVAQFTVLSMFAMVSWMVFVNGGILSTSLMWYASIPFAAIFVGGPRSGIAWALLSFMMTGIMLWLSKSGQIPASPIPHEAIPGLQAKSLIGLTLVVLALALAYDKAKSSSLAKLEQAREAAEQASAAMAQMMEQLSRSIGSATKESRDIAGSTRNIALTMQGQKERAENMVVIAQQMAVLTAQNASQSDSATLMAQDAGQAANDGGHAMEQAMTQLNAAGTAIAAAADRMEELGKRSSEVSGIVQLIRDIADQTNLLALNAAIEAARAGELGRGFAVVADEVRKLAERTQQSTLDIEQKIRLIVDGTNRAIDAIRDGNNQMQAGRNHTEDARIRLQKIIHDTHKMALLLDEVAAAEQQQNNGFARFASDISAVGDASRSLSHEAVSIAEATGRLDTLLAELGNSVSHFQQQAHH